MGKVHRQERDPILALYKTVADLGQQIRQLRNGHVAVPVLGSSSNPQNDGDGALWIDNSDNKIHYAINGNEYVVTSTLVGPYTP